MEDDIKVVLFKSDVMKAIEMYLSQLLFKRRRIVTELELSENEEGDDLFAVTLAEPPVEERE